MTNVLSYRTQAADRRWSRQAIWALSVGVLGAPLFVGVLWVMDQLHLDSRPDMVYALAALVGLPLAGIGLSLASGTRILRSGGRLHGLRLASAGAIASIVWPTAILWYAIGHLC